jgi:hypothetical protein
LNQDGLKSNLVKSDSAAAEHFQGQDKYSMGSQSALLRDCAPATAENCRRPYSARQMKRSANETERLCTGQKRPGSARPYKLDFESSSANQSSDLDVSFPRFTKKLNLNEQICLESEPLGPYKSESRKTDTRFNPCRACPADFAQSHKKLHPPITTKQRPHSARISGQNSLWQERVDSGPRKMSNLRKRPASAKQPEKNWSLLDGSLLDSVKSFARTTYDQLNLDVKARTELKYLVSTNMKKNDSAQRNKTFRFNLKIHESLTDSIQNKGQDCMHIFLHAS